MYAHLQKNQRGFGTRQALLLLTLAGLATVFCIQKYNDFVTQTRVSEAIYLATESKLRVSEFYTLSARFPENAAEKASVTTKVLTPPDYVSEIVIEETGDEHDVMVKVYFKDGILDDFNGERPFVYMAANLSDRRNRSLQWNCGAHGVDAGLLPGDCRS